MSKNTKDLSKHVIFLGIAERVKSDSELNYPDGQIDIFRLTKQPVFIVFPLDLNTHNLVFLFEEKQTLGTFKLSLKAPTGAIIGQIEVTRENITKDNESEPGRLGLWTLSNCSGKGIVIPEPGEYKLGVDVNGKFKWIGSVIFNYKRYNPFTSEEIDAIKSNPYFRKAVQGTMHCKHCDDKSHIYTSLKRMPDVEAKGYIWQHDLQEDFKKCKCGKSSWNLKYIRESMHAMLLHEALPYPGGMSYERYYAYSEIVKIINKYNALIANESLEEPIQKFITDNQVMLAKFAAKKIYFKKDILGKFVTDIVIYDINKTLIFIELERANLKLFKENGHATADLNHAYEQVKDWLREYAKYAQAILESLGLQPNDVATVRGLVIAGRSTQEKPQHYERHVFKLPYTDIDFMTFDELGRSVAQISRELA